jgi:hypothetical protein
MFQDDARVTGDPRHEGDHERLNRNYNELLQELRVAETGVQLLFAFLLSVAFQVRFAELNTFQLALYFVSLMSAAISVVVLIAPVSAHRLVFRRRRKDDLVAWTSRLAAAGLVFLLLSMLGAILLIADVYLGAVGAALLTAGLAVFAGWLWYVRPSRWRTAPDRPVEADRS